MDNVDGLVNISKKDVDFSEDLEIETDVPCFTVPSKLLIVHI